MSNVTIELGGRKYTVACGEGEEGHLSMLGETIQAKLASVPGLSGQSPERTLLYAALLLADELHEAQGKPERAFEQATEILEDLAGGLESLASRLESA